MARGMHYQADCTVTALIGKHELGGNLTVIETEDREVGIYEQECARWPRTSEA